MRVRMIGLLVVISSLSASGRVESPLPRLEIDNPLISDKFHVREIRLGDRRLASRLATVPARANQAVEITGHIRSGSWSASGISSFWIQPRDQVRKYEQYTRAGDKHVMLFLYVHGNQPDVNLGVVNFHRVEVKQFPKKLDEVEFRVNFVAPAQRGTYVIDLQAQEITAAPRRGETLSKPIGFPFWRAELVVD